MNPITAVLVVVVIVILMMAGFGVLIILGTLADWNQERRRKP